jgi:hypothetical protein
MVAQREKTASKARSTAKRRSVARNAKSGQFTPVAYAVDFSDLTGRKPPPGVSIALVPSSPQAEAELKQWGKVRKTNRVVTMVGRAPLPVAPKAIEATAFEPDARSRALLRGREIAIADLEAAGGAFNLEQVRQLLNDISRQRVEKRVQEGSLLWVPGPGNRRRYPTVQFTRKGEVVDGLKAVRDALPTQDPWAVLNFFVQPDARLGGRKPIDVLKAGEVDLVLSAARAMAQQGG